KFNLIDTAGLHDSNDLVESIGISKAKDILKNADIVLFVVDGSQELDSFDKDIIKLLNDKKAILVVNKCDLKQKIDINILPHAEHMECSALQNKGILEIKEKIYSMVIDEKVLSQNVIITNIRHAEALSKSNEIILKVIKDLKSGANLELVSLNLQSAWETLGLITGVSSTEEIIANIFSKFCVGK
ncbi:MAG: GTP-binding protein, partial [Clostridia bacterium]|nr:GTP-binding protein [Clostridia bacterium]